MNRTARRDRYREGGGGRGGERERERERDKARETERDTKRPVGRQAEIDREEEGSVLAVRLLSDSR